MTVRDSYYDYTFDWTCNSLFTGKVDDDGATLLFLRILLCMCVCMCMTNNLIFIHYFAFFGHSSRQL